VTQPSPSPGQLSLLILPTMLLLSAYAFAPEMFGTFRAQEWWWAGLGLWDFPAALRALLIAIPFAILWLPAHGVSLLWEKSRALVAPIQSLPPFWLLTLGIVVFWVFRQTDLRFGDSIFYARVLIPEQAFSDRGVYLSYDELLASVIGSVGYRYLQSFFHWDPVTSYNFLNLTLTFLFFAALWVFRERRALFLTLVPAMFLISGNWNQVMMGGMEHYGGVMMCTAGFMIFAIEALSGRMRLWVPCLFFSVGAAFHLVIGWFFPTLALLVLSRWRHESREGRIAAILALTGPAFVYLCIAHYFGFDLGFFFKSHASQVKMLPFLKADDPYISDNIFYSSVVEPRRLAHLTSEIFLMGFPGLMAMAAFLPFRGGAFLRHPAAKFLLLAAVCGLTFIFLWNNELPYYVDQDLYSFVGLPLCFIGGVLAAGDDAGRWLGENRERALLAVLSAPLIWRVMNLLHHSVLSQNYSSPWVVYDRVF